MCRMICVEMKNNIRKTTKTQKDYCYLADKTVKGCVVSAIIDNTKFVVYFRFKCFAFVCMARNHKADVNCKQKLSHIFIHICVCFRLYPCPISCCLLAKTPLSFENNLVCDNDALYTIMDYMCSLTPFATFIPKYFHFFFLYCFTRSQNTDTHRKICDSFYTQMQIW